MPHLESIHYRGLNPGPFSCKATRYHCAMLPQYEHLYRQLSDRFIAPYMRDFLYNALRQVLAFDFDLQTFISRDFSTSRR